jgi:hypothetical protein
VNQEQIEAGFDEVRRERTVRAHLDDVLDAAFWRRLNPALTISDDPFARPRRRVQVDAAVVDRAKRQLLGEGYMQTPPVVIDEELVRLREGIGRLTEAGFPSGMGCVYDEFYRAFQGLDDLFEPLLGCGYEMVLHGAWTFCIPPGDPALGRSGTIAPHRDAAPDAAIVQRQLPDILSVWIPLVDVTTLDSCLYIVPAPADPDYYAADRRAVRGDQIRFQDIRALPAQAGSVLAWTSRLIHWGSRSSGFASAPRIAASAYLQRRDAPRWKPSIIDFTSPVPFERRLQWIEASYGVPGLFARQ